MCLGPEVYGLISQTIATSAVTFEKNLVWTHIEYQAMYKNIYLQKNKKINNKRNGDSITNLLREKRRHKQHLGHILSEKKTYFETGYQLNQYQVPLSIS